MSVITLEDIPKLRCANCEYYKYDPHKINIKQHKCTYNSHIGQRILGAEENIASHTPDYCPLVTPEEIAINKGTSLAKKIAKKEKRLSEAKRLCEELPVQLDKMYKQLEQILTSV